METHEKLTFIDGRVLPYQVSVYPRLSLQHQRQARQGSGAECLACSVSVGREWSRVEQQCK